MGGIPGGGTAQTATFRQNEWWVRVFVDTSVWFAAANIRDQYNASAKRILSTLGAHVLSDHVLVETWGLLRIRVHRQAAEQFWLGIRRGVGEVEKGDSD